MHIKRAALLYERGGIIEGRSYSEIRTLAYQSGIGSSYIIGFVDNHDNFIDRNAAAKIAKEARQVPVDFTGPLNPEDLYDVLENECAD